MTGVSLADGANLRTMLDHCCCWKIGLALAVPCSWNVLNTRCTLDRAKRAPVESTHHHPVDACGAQQSYHIDLIDIALADWDVRGKVLDMEGLTVNDASVTPHDGGSSWTLDSLGIGEPLDQYSVTYFLTETK